MHRAPAVLLLLALAGCEEELAQDRLTAGLADGASNARVDLDPITATEVDNNVSVVVTLDAAEDSVTDTQDPKEVLLLQYRVVYTVGDIHCDDEGSDCSYIAGELQTQVVQDSTETMTLRAAAQAQLNWAKGHHTGDQTDIPARVELQGYFGSPSRLESYQEALADGDDEEVQNLAEKLERVSIGYDYVAIFAEYGQGS